MKRLFICLILMSFLGLYSMVFAQSVKVFDFDYRILKTVPTNYGPYTTITWKMNAENKSSTNIEGYAGYKFIDKDGFELEGGSGQIITLRPWEKRTVTGKRTLPKKILDEATQIRYYFKRY